MKRRGSRCFSTKTPGERPGRKPITSWGIRRFWERPECATGWATATWKPCDPPSKNTNPTRGISSCSGGIKRLRFFKEERPSSLVSSPPTRSENGYLNPNLKPAANLTTVSPLFANFDLSNRGFCLFGAGFIVDPETAVQLHGSSDPNTPTIIHDCRNGRDLTSTPRGVKVIDAFGLSADELSAKHPGIFQHLLTTVKPAASKPSPSPTFPRASSKPGFAISAKSSTPTARPGRPNIPISP